MLKEQRHRYILSRLGKGNVLAISELCQSLSASYMTIWRDLNELEVRGLLQRVRGGAISTGSPVPASHAIFPDFDPNRDVHYQSKVLIGRYAAEELVEAGDSITIEAGTTTSSMVEFLNQPRLTLLTNGLVTALKAASLPEGTTVMCSGGILIETGAFIGPQAEDFFSNFRVKKGFFGAKGLSLKDGFTDPTPLYGQLKSVMKTNAEVTIMLVDSSKFSVSSLIQVMSLDEADILVTDPEAPQDIIEGLEKRGIDVRIAR